MVGFSYIKNISETINFSIDINECMIGYIILNKLIGFIKRHKDKNNLNANNNDVYQIF